MLERTNSAPALRADVLAAFDLLNREHRLELLRLQRLRSSESVLKLSDKTGENFELNDIVNVVDNLPDAIAFVQV